MDDHKTAAVMLYKLVRRGAFGGVDDTHNKFVMSLAGSARYAHDVYRYKRQDGSVREAAKERLRVYWKEAFPDKPYPQVKATKAVNRSIMADVESDNENLAESEGNA